MVDPKPVSNGVPKKRATIKDVARASNVSPMTVSNVLNDKMQFVSSKTKARVEREIARLNYRRQTAGRNLRSADQRSIGLVVVSDDSAFLEDQFAAKVAAGLANSLNKVDYTLTVQGVRADALSDAMIMRNFDVAGVCAMISGPIEVRKKVVKQLHALSQPLILFQQTNTEEVDDLCTIRLDESASGEIIGDHLLARGVRSILALRPKQHWFAIERRFEGIQKAMSNTTGTPTFTVLEAASESQISVQTALEDFLEKNPLPDAIVGGNDQIALAAMLLMADRGVSVPKDVRIAGFNGFEAHRYLRPQLTTVASPAYDLGDRAGAMILNRLSSGSFSTHDLVLPIHFSPGGTT